MPKYTVFYIRLSDEQVKIVNSDGWASDVGRAYLAAKMRYDYSEALTMKMIEAAAVIDDGRFDSDEPEAIWSMMQSLGAHWTQLPNVRQLTNFPRSMDVGDVLYDHYADAWAVVASMGFEPLEEKYIIEGFNDLLFAIVDPSRHADGTTGPAAS